MKTIPGIDTRPTTDRIKETLFNILQPELLECRFLDLFSGSGGIGIEALSRGASYAVFVEKNPKAAACIRENLAFTKLAEDGKLLNMDVLQALRSLEGKGVFDIIFMDPPYNNELERQVLEYLKDSTVADKNTLIIGADPYIRNLLQAKKDLNYSPVAMLDDKPELINTYISNLKVYAFDDLKRVIKSRDIEAVIISKTYEQKSLIEIFETLNKLEITDIKVINNLQDNKELKDISVEDLLARHPKDLDKELISNFIKDKIVLITGAGGSIGSEISRQCAKFGAKRLILLDHSEFNLYTIAEELNSVKPVLVMQSVINRDFLDLTFDKYKPQIVIHAAAYKHVPLVEDNIPEAILNNIIGTKNSIDCAVKHNVEKFVLISTDKAVRPTNVMGTTKRICELYAQNVEPKNTEIVAVRFGNVLGSSGSVIPKFKMQISQNGPITVTHPDITRYFMLIPEACELVLQAASIGKGGEIFILDMGEPIKIVDLAKKMIELSGKENIKIEFTGLRPGEKLYEELLISDSDMKTQYESITVASKTYFDMDVLNKKINELVDDKDKILKLKEIVPEFDHKINNQIISII